MRKLLTKILSVIVAVTATLGLIMLPKTSVQANEEQFTFGATYGASVRYGDDIEVGLRFTIEVDKEYYKTLIGDEYESKNVKFGALVAPLWYVNNNLGGNLAINPEDENIADVCYVDHTTKFDQQQRAESASHVYYATVTYRFDDEWKAEVLAKYAKEMPDASEEEIFTHAKLEALATELVCMPYHIVEGEEPVYAKLSDARSMVKVANGAVIDGENLPSDFNSKYLSTLVESTSEIYIEENGTIYGATEADYNALNGATVTANADAGDVEFTIENGVLTNASEFFVGYEVGNYYYVTAFKGHEVYRIKYMYVTGAIDEAEDFKVFLSTADNKDRSLNGYVGYYVLTKDIDATGYKHGTHLFSNDSTYSSGSDKGFKGTFDGRGHTVDNFTSVSNGLFGYLTAPIIKNIAFTNVNITGYYGSLFAHAVNRDGWNGTSYTKEALFENIYIQINKVTYGGSSRVGILANNQLPTSVRIENVVVEYTNAKQDGVYDKVFAGTHEFGIFGGNTNNSMQKTLMYKNAYAITEIPIMYTRGNYPYFAENQVEHTISNGYWIETVGQVYDERITEFLTLKGKTLNVHMVAHDLRTYENYVDMAGDFIEVEGEEVYANADSMLTFSKEYWTVVNGVPYWKTAYPSKVALTVVDKEGLPASDIVLDNNIDTYEVNFVDASGFILPELSISAPEGITVEGNKVRLTNVPLEATTYTIEVSALYEGYEFTESFTISTVDAVDFIITDVKGNELNEILFENNRQEVIFNFKHISGYYFEGTTILPNDAIVVNGNRIKLAEDTSSKGSFDITVVGNIGGIEVTEVVTINYTNEVDVEGNVLYSKDDLSLDLQSLKRALLTKGVEIHNLNSIKGYVVGETTYDVLDLEVIISGLNTYDVHDDTVDTIQEVKLLIGSKEYNINVLAYTKLIDEAQDLDYFRYKYKETGTVMLHDGYYLVTKNIDASNYEMKTHSFASNTVYPGSNSTHNDKKAGLSGVFDGNGYVIDDLSVQSNGIFAWINGGVVKDIAFTNVTLLAGNYPTLFAHTVDAGNTNRALFENIYVQVKSMAAESGVLVNNNMNGAYAALENTVVDFTSFGEKELGWLTAGGGRFGSVTDLAENGGTYAANGTTARYPNLMKNVFSITSAPVVALRTSGTTISRLTVASNQVSVTNNTEITVLDSKLTSLLSKFDAYTITPENVQHGVKVYETFNDMANDYESNKTILDTFDDNWIVVDGVPYWKQLYYRNFDIEVNGESANSVFLPNNKVELEIDVVDMNGNSINPVITAPEGIILEGNKIKLVNDPAFEGYYEVLFTFEVDGITIERVLTVNFSNVINVDSHVLYSNMDKSLDIISLNKALEEVYVDPITLDQIEEYRVDGEVVDVLDLEVVISGQINQRTIKTYVVEFVLDGKLYVLNDVGAYTLVLDDFADLDYISAPVDTVLPDGRVALAEYTGYYIMAKNLDGTGLGGVDKDGNPVNYTIAGSTSADGGKKVRGLSGVFDGNGYTISNAIVQSRGIFGMIKGGWLKNIGFKNMKLTGNYMCLLAHQFAYYNSNKTNEQGYVTDIYVEGTDVSFISSNKEYGLLFQNQLYGYVERAVIKHTLNDTEKMYMKQGKRSGLFASQYNYNPQTGGVQVHLNRWIVIGDTPVAYDNSTSAGWNKFVFAKNMLKTNANGELELIDPTSFSFINELFTLTTGEGESAVRVWQPVFNGGTDVANKVDEAQYVRQYISDEAMANDKEGCAEMLSHFTSPYWVISESGTITWRTAI